MRRGRSQNVLSVGFKAYAVPPSMTPSVGSRKFMRPAGKPVEVELGRRCSRLMYPWAVAHSTVYFSQTWASIPFGKGNAISIPR
jgi:hypothetical protein